MRFFVGISWWIALPLLAVYGAFWILVFLLRLTLTAVAATVLAAVWLFSRRPRPLPDIPLTEVAPARWPIGDGYMVCPEHGAVLMQPDVGPGVAVDPYRMEVLDTRMSRPSAGDAVACFCGRSLRAEIRPRQ